LTGKTQVCWEWVVVRRSESSDAKSTLLFLSEIKASLEDLKNCGFKPFRELDWTAVKPLDKKRN